MSSTPYPQKTTAQLREKAEFKIQGGLMPVTRGWTVGASSLTLLHRLASDPETASDALKLLHELQVHQVELDLQHEHMNEERLDLEQSENRLKDLFVHAPVAYLIVNSAGLITDANIVATRLLGVERDDVGSLSICRLVAPDSRPALLALLKQVRASGVRHSCTVEALETLKPRFLDVIASTAPSGQHCLVVILEVSVTAT